MPAVLSHNRSSCEEEADDTSKRTLKEVADVHDVVLQGNMLSRPECTRTQLALTKCQAYGVAAPAMYDIGVWSVVPKYRPDSVTKDGAEVGVFNVPATVMQGQSGKVPQVGYKVRSVVPQPS